MNEIIFQEKKKEKEERDDEPVVRLYTPLIHCLRTQSLAPSILPSSTTQTLFPQQSHFSIAFGAVNNYTL